MTTSPTMQSFVQMYLEERRSAGFALEVPGNLLMGFACFSDQRGYRGPITEQLILDWVQGCAGRATHSPGRAGYRRSGLLQDSASGWTVRRTFPTEAGRQ